MRARTLSLELTEHELSGVAGGSFANEYGESDLFSQWLEDYPYRVQSLREPNAPPVSSNPSAVSAGPVDFEAWQQQMEQRREDAYFYRLDDL